jgi:hypothetical protein
MAATAPDVVRSLLQMAAAAIVLLVAVGASTVLHLAAAAVPLAAQNGVTVSVNQRQVRALRTCTPSTLLGQRIRGSTFFYLHV